MNKDKVEAFLWRFYNTFKTTIWPVMAGAMYTYFQNHAGNLSVIASWDFWNYVIYAVIIAILGSALAGAEKVIRSSQE